MKIRQKRCPYVLVSFVLTVRLQRHCTKKASRDESSLTQHIRQYVVICSSQKDVVFACLDVLMHNIGKNTHL